MVEVGIPVWHSRDTLCKCLDSLVAQTLDRFITCLSIDCDGEDYSDIIEKYRTRGLKIRIINGKENGGPGAARQRILDTTQCDFLIFVDSDDILMPRAIEVLHRAIIAGNYDIVRSSIIREQNSGNDIIMRASDNTITWFHGKIYRTKYLKTINISFLPGLRTDEDAYFNAIAWNCTSCRGILDEITYIWRDNKNSITRSVDSVEYFKKRHMDYIRGQVEALKAIFEKADDVSNLFVTNTLINIYYYYMKARFYKQDEKEMDECISTLKNEKWMQLWLNTGENWMDIISNIKPGEIYEGQYIVFYEETFNLWAARLLRKE